MTREQYERGKEIYSNLNACDSILERIVNMEGSYVSDLYIYGKLPSEKDYQFPLNISGIITSDELSNFITDKVKKRKIELESELAKI